MSGGTRYIICKIDGENQVVYAGVCMCRTNLSEALKRERVELLLHVIIAAYITAVSSVRRSTLGLFRQAVIQNLHSDLK